MNDNDGLIIKGLEDYNPDDEEDLGSTYDPKSAFQKPLIVQEAVRACRESRGKEMIKGFWNTKLDKFGNAIKTWHDDERKVYINNVIALYNILPQECNADEEFQKSYKELKEQIKKLTDKYSYVAYEFNPVQNGWKKTDMKYIPQVDEELLVPSPQNPRTLVNIQGGWNNKINAYYDALVPIYDEIFREINLVIARTNDFAQKMSL